MSGRFIRSFDSLERISVPIDFRRALRWDGKTRISMTFTENSVILKTDMNTCVLCGSGQNLRGVNEKFICEVCVATLK